MGNWPSAIYISVVHCIWWCICMNLNQMGATFGRKTNFVTVWPLSCPLFLSWDICMMGSLMTYAANIFILIYDFAAYKYRRYAPNISILSEKGKILKDFPNVTLLQLAIFQTVFWLFGYRLTLNVSQNMVLVATYLYKIIQKLFAALQEPIFLEYFFKVWMSHCYKSFVRKWYKITILIITFLFVNGFQVWDMRWI